LSGAGIDHQQALPRHPPGKDEKFAGLSLADMPQQHEES
jgi:hypothetical protein